MVKVHVGESNIKGIGKGLFAIERISKGDMIVEFTGKVLKPKETPTNGRSNIFFNDGSVLQCDSNDLASYANDIVIFPTKSRNLLSNLLKKKPFYPKHKNIKINAIIANDEDNHRAYLVAKCDISKHDEIYVHYGFMHWIKMEYYDLGFLDEQKLSLDRIPIYLYQYDAFFAYVKVFYPRYASHEIVPFNKKYDKVILYSEDGEYYNAIMMGILNICCC